MKNITRMLGVSLITLLAACSQDAVSPTASAVTAAASSNAARGPSTPQNARGVFESSEHIGVQTQNVLMFTKGVSSNVEVRQVIGPAGGVLRLPSTGLTLIVPPGAVAAPIEFRVKANNNRLVAYDFEPHGTKFAVPLIYQQDLSKTSYKPGMILGGGYYADPTKLNLLQGMATTDEQYSAQLDPLGYVIFTIKHFSGYLVSCA